MGELIWSSYSNSLSLRRSRLRKRLGVTLTYNSKWYKSQYYDIETRQAGKIARSEASITA